MTTPAVAALILQIEAAVRPLADARQAVPMRAYMLDQFAFLGIRAAPRRQALRGLPRLNTWTAPELLDAHFSDRGRLFQADRGRRFSAIVDAQRCAQARV